MLSSRLAASCAVALLMGACTGAGRAPTSPAAALVPSEADLMLEFNFLEPAKQRQFLSDPQEMQKLIDAVYFRRRMTQLGEGEYNYRQDPKIVALMQRDHEYRLGNWVPAQFLAKLQIPDQKAAARAYYDANHAEFTPKPALHLQAIFLQATDAESRARQRRLAEKLLGQLRKGADFAELASKYSEDGSRQTNGDIGDNIMQGSLFPQVEPAVFALKNAGDLSEVVESPYGIHLFKLLGRRDPVVLPYEQVEPRLLDRLQGEYREKALKDWIDQMAPASASKLDDATLERLMAEIRKAQEAAAAADGG